LAERSVVRHSGSRSCWAVASAPGRELRGRPRGSMLVDVTAYQKELVRGDIDTENGVAQPGAGRTAGRS